MLEPGEIFQLDCRRGASRTAARSPEQPVRLLQVLLRLCQCALCFKHRKCGSGKHYVATW